MRNKSKLIIALFLSFLIIFSNISFVFAEDEVVNTEEPQIEQTEKTETEEVKVEPVVEETKPTLAKTSDIDIEDEEDEEETYRVTYTYKVWDQWAECEEGTLLSEETHTAQYKVGDEVWMPSIVSNGSYAFPLPGHPQEVLWSHAGTILYGGGNPEDLGAEFIYPDGYLIPSMVAEDVDLIYNYGPLYDIVRCEDYLQDDNGEYKLASSADYTCSIGSNVTRKSKEIDGYIFNNNLSNLIVHLTLRALGDDVFKLTRYWDKIKVEPEPEPELIVPTPEPEPEPIEPTKPEPKTPQPQPQIQPTEDITIATTNPPTTTINPAPTPKAKPEGSWALINLIATILACICALTLLFVRKDTEDNEPTDEEKKDMRKILATKIASILVGIISIIAFILTEDMSLPMVLTDKWTFLMILLLIIEIVNIFIIRHQSQGEEDNDSN